MRNLKRIFKVLAIALVVVVVQGLGVVDHALAQQLTTPKANTLAGGMQFLGAAAANPTVTHSGKFVVTLTLSIKSTIPTNQPILCSATVNGADTAFPFTYVDTSGIAATLNGSAARPV